MSAFDRTIKKVVEQGEYLTTIEHEEYRDYLVRRERRNHDLEFQLDRDYLEYEGVIYVRANHDQCFILDLAEGEDWQDVLEWWFEEE